MTHRSIEHSGPVSKQNKPTDESELGLFSKAAEKIKKAPLALKMTACALAGAAVFGTRLW